MLNIDVFVFSCRAIGCYYFHMIKIKFNPISPMLKLESTRNHRYTFTEMAEIGGMSKQLARKMLSAPMESPGRATLEGLLNFFSAEGMPITINDLFDIDDVEQ